MKRGDNADVVRGAANDNHSALKKKKSNQDRAVPVTEEQGLEWLLHPVKVEEFRKSYWEKQPLHLKRGNAQYYSQVFSTQDIRNLMEVKQVLYIPQDLQICRVADGARINYEPLPKDEEHDDDDDDDEDDEEEEEDGGMTPEEVWAAHGNGWTLQVYQPQNYCVPLARLMSRLEDAFGSLCGANSYLTPKGSQGLAAHYDDVEVFILQVEGRKRWRLYYPPNDLETLPEEYSPDFTPEDVSGFKLHSEITVEEGDLLYFPRGWIHQAVTGGSQVSHHVTLSTYQKHNVKALLSMAFEKALEAAWDDSLELRKGLPWALGSQFGSIAPDATASSLFAQSMTKIVASVVKKIDIGDAVDELNLQFIQARLPPAEVLDEDRLEEERMNITRLIEEDEGGDDQEEDYEENDEIDEAQAIQMFLGDQFGADEDDDDRAEMFRMLIPPGGDGEGQDVDDDDDDDDDDGDDDERNNDEQEEDDDDDDDGEAFDIPLEECEVRLGRPEHFLWTVGDEEIACYVSHNNFVTLHMNGKTELNERVQEELTFPKEVLPGLQYLLSAKGFVRVDSIPLETSVRDVFVRLLGENGLVEIRKKAT